MTSNTRIPNSAVDLMTSKLLTVRQDEALMGAWRLMRDRKIRHLPVADTDGNIVGILTDRDLQRAIHTEFDHNGEVRFTIERFAAGEVVADYMTSPAQTVAFDTPVLTVALQMLEKKISSLLVTESNSEGSVVVGIITTDDLLWALVRLLNEQNLADKKEPVGAWIGGLYTSPVGGIINQISNAGI